MVRLALIALVVSLPVSASAEYLTGNRSGTQSAPEAEFWEYQNQPMVHDRGFYLRGTVGPAWFVSRTHDIGPDTWGTRLRLEGAGMEFGAAVGGVVAPGVVIHGTAIAMVSPRPRVVAQDVSTTGGNAGFVLFGFGPGITGYLPSNFWGSLSFGGSVASYDFAREDIIEPDNGYGLFFDMAIGKEWWVGSYAGIGIFGRLTSHRVTTDYPEPFGGVTLSTGLTVSLN